MPLRKRTDSDTGLAAHLTMSTDMIDYELLRFVWWMLLGILLIGFTLTSGADLGVGAILRLIGRDDIERQMAIEVIDTHWKVSLVWLIVGSGAVFAAWPLLYAVSFSVFYFAILLVLLALILRPVSFMLRNRRPDARWRDSWDWALTVSGVLPALVFGVLFGNLFLGVPFHFTPSMLPDYEESFGGLLHPFALLAGLVSLSMIVMYGACFAAMKIRQPVGDRARHIARFAAGATALLFIGSGLWLWTIEAPVIINKIAFNGPSDPLAKEVLLASSAWLANYGRAPALAAIPILAVLMLGSVVVVRNRRVAFVASGLAVAAIILTAGTSLFPFLMSSSSEPSQGLTVWDASSSERTLGIMLIATALLVPIAIIYTVWVLLIRSGRVTRALVDSQSRIKEGP